MNIQQTNQEYLNNKLREVKSFMKNNFPDFYINLYLKVTPIYNATHNGGGFHKEEGLRIYTTKPKKALMKDQDKISNIFEIKLKRKNSYFISLIHEYCEGLFCHMDSNTKREIMKKYLLDPASQYSLGHQFATGVELEALDILIAQAEKQDKRDFLKRKQARLEDLEQK